MKPEGDSGFGSYHTLAEEERELLRELKSEINWRRTGAAHTQHALLSRSTGAMGKSHRSKKLKIHEEDLRREREEAERKAALAQKRAESAERKMEVERAKSATSKFSKAVKHGKKGIGGVRGSGVRKPNYIMKKSLKKAAKAREMDEG